MVDNTPLSRAKRSEHLRIYCLKRRTRLEWRKSKFVYVRYKDAQTQTSGVGHRNASYGREEEEEEEEEEEVLLKCGVCLEQIRGQTTRLLVSLCGHGICSICFQKLKKNHSSSIKCPICRTENDRESGFVKVNFLSAKTFGIDERKRFFKKIEFINSKIMIRLKLQIDKLLTLENSRIKHLSLPMSCSSKQLSQRRCELLGSLDSIEIRTLLGNFSHLLFKLTKTLKKMEKDVETHSHLEIDIAHFAKTYFGKKMS